MGDYAMTCHYGQQSGDFSSYWGYSAQQCQAWMDQEIQSLNARVAAMQDVGSLTGRKRAQAFAAGIEAQKTLDTYSQCSVFWEPVDPQPLIQPQPPQGYTEEGAVDVSDFGRENQPLTDNEESYSEPQTAVDPYPSEPPVDTHSSEPLVDPYPSEPLVDPYPSAPLTDDSYSEPKTAPQTVDPYNKDSSTADLTEGTYTEDTADLTEEVKDPYVGESSGVKLTEGTYTEDTADLTAEVKDPGPY